ncbi:hypothetical protein [Gluconacetobacter tumulicola]|uniref:Uncharacterized protein n=1 Tax=Gluconacetobacter tumulicola TaxID=1017177 RepID=A0A7W4JAE3_9PROT|nr:hypothetical protein [Gluconacetobacter tumulicola]MBB2177633.1 hypothetical protein [Gluconacetobacter tumulicola]
MVTKLHLDALRSDIASVQAMLARSRGRDPMGEMSLRARLQGLEAQLSAFEQERGTKANVALVFDGNPVRGSSAIDANFAGQALQDYQDLITRQMASVSNVDLGVRGQIPMPIKQQSRMNITALVHGSFGFMLEENDDGQQALLETPTRAAVRLVTNLLKGAAAADERWFEDQLPEIDVRLFASLRNFISTLHKAGSTLKLSEKERDLRLTPEDVERAYERTSQVEVEEVENSIVGELLGIVPIARRFEFRTSNGEIISGRVAGSLSADYLERLEREELIGGKGWRALIRTKTVSRPDGRHSSISHILVDLFPT